MRARRNRADRRHQLDPDCALPASNGLNGGKAAVGQFEMKRRTVHLEPDCLLHNRGVGLFLVGGDGAGPIAIDFPDDGVGDLHAGGQIQLDLHALRIERDAGGLEVLVATMGGQAGTGADDQRQRHGSAAPPQTVEHSAVRERSATKTRTHEQIASRGSNPFRLFSF